MLGSDQTPLYETYDAYNKRHCAAVAALSTCFPVGEQVVYGTLSHSHLSLVLRSLVSGALWPEPQAYRQLTPKQDKEGRWEYGILSDKDPELEAIIKSGLAMEVLSWKIYTEEPEACSMISAALNKGHQVALRQTEMTAVAAYWRCGQADARGTSQQGGIVRSSEECRAPGAGRRG